MNLSNSQKRDRNGSKGILVPWSSSPTVSPGRHARFRSAERMFGYVGFRIVGGWVSVRRGGGVFRRCQARAGYKLGRNSVIPQVPPVSRLSRTSHRASGMPVVRLAGITPRRLLGASGKAAGAGGPGAGDL